VSRIAALAICRFICGFLSILLTFHLRRPRHQIDKFRWQTVGNPRYCVTLSLTGGTKNKVFGAKAWLPKCNHQLVLITIIDKM